MYYSLFVCLMLHRKIYYPPFNCHHSRNLVSLRSLLVIKISGRRNYFVWCKPQNFECMALLRIKFRPYFWWVARGGGLHRRENGWVAGLNVELGREGWVGKLLL